MTIDEARELCQLQLESLMSNPQVTLDPKYIQAERIAIASFEAWKEFKQEIMEYCLKGVTNGDIISAELCAIIDKHLQEIKNG